MKILHIIKKTSYDGATVYPIRLISQLSEYDHELLSIYRGSAHNEIINRKVKCKSLLGEGDDKISNKLIKTVYFTLHLIRNKYDIIHYHLGGIGILFIATIFGRKAKVIHHIHSGNIVGNIKSNKLRLIQKILLMYTKNHTLKIAVSENVKLFYKNTIGDRSNINVIENFSDFTFNDEKNSLHNGIGFLGRIVKEKGFLTFINIIEDLKYSSTKYNFFAKGDVYNFSKNINELVIEGKLKLLPPSFLIEELFNKIDLLIFPSTAPEAFPLVLIEAMSFDIGIIALKSKSVSGILGDYPLIVDELKTELFIKKIEEYYSNSELRKKLSCIHKLIAKKYSKEKPLSKIEQIYNSIHRK